MRICGGLGESVLIYGGLRWSLMICDDLRLPGAAWVYLRRPGAIWGAQGVSVTPKERSGVICGYLRLPVSPSG